jgi:uncharacterized protein
MKFASLWPWPAGLLVLALVGFLLVLAAIAWFQDRLLYFPARASVTDMSSAQLVAWPDAANFRGLVADPVGPVRGTAIVFHGNAGHAGHRTFYAQALTAQGLRVILAEYPGYGPRDGAVSERSLVDDAVQTLALARRQYGAPLLVIGESLGAGVAASASARQPEQVAALLLITPWDRLERVAAFHYPWLPVTWLLRDRYDSAAALATFDRPVLVAVAEQDDIVPARFGAALHDRLPGRKRLEVIRASSHNDWVMQVDAAWWGRAVAYLLDGPAPP